MKGKKISLVVEAEFGKDNATPKPYSVCVSSLGLVSTDEMEENKCIGAGDTGGDKTKIGDKQGGDLVMNATYENAYFPLAMQYGEPTTVDNGDGTFTHTFSSSKDCIPSYSVQSILDDAGDCGSSTTEWVERFNGCKANTLKLTADKSQPKFTLGLMAAKFGASYLTPATVKVDETNEVVLSKTPILSKTAVISFDGATYCRLSKFEVSSDNGIKETNVICDVGTVLEKENYATTVSIEGIFDKALVPRIAANETVAMGLKYTDGTNVLEFVFAEMQGEFKSQAITGMEKLKLSETLTAVRVNGAERCKVVLTNGVASYN